MKRTPIKKAIRIIRDLNNSGMTGVEYSKRFNIPIKTIYNYRQRVKKAGIVLEEPAPQNPPVNSTFHCEVPPLKHCPECGEDLRPYYEAKKAYIKKGCNRL